MANFGPLTAEIGSGVWGNPANFNGFHVLVALLNGTQVVGVSQTLQRLVEGASYTRQGGHHVLVKRYLRNVNNNVCLCDTIDVIAVGPK